MIKISKKLAFALLAFTAAGFARAQEAHSAQSSEESAQTKVFAPATLADKNMDFFFRVPPNTLMIPNVRRVYRDEKFLLIPLGINLVKKNGDTFKGMFRILLKDPSGRTKVMAEKEIDDVVSVKDALYMFPATAEIFFEETDGLGDYEITLELENLDTGEKTSAATPVTLAEWAKPSPADAGDINRKVVSFNGSYSPEDLYAIFTSPGLSMKQANIPVNYSLYSFFKNAFMKHDFLLKFLAEDFKTQTGEQRYNTLLVFGALDKLGMLDATESEIETAKEMTKFAKEFENYAACSLDSLWGDFFATGRYEPVEKLIEATKYKSEGKKLLARMKDESVEITEEELQKGILYMAAGWSIDANMPRNPLLNRYVNYAFMHMNEQEKQDFVEALKDGRKRMDSSQNPADAKREESAPIDPELQTEQPQ